MALSLFGSGSGSGSNTSPRTSSPSIVLMLLLLLGSTSAPSDNVGGDPPPATVFRGTQCAIHLCSRSISDSPFHHWRYGPSSASRPNNEISRRPSTLASSTVGNPRTFLPPPLLLLLLLLLTLTSICAGTSRDDISASATCDVGAASTMSSDASGATSAPEYPRMEAHPRL